MSYCQNCGFKLEGEYEFCPECGTKIIKDEDTPSFNPERNVFTQTASENSRRCPGCGAVMPEGAYYCLSCGNMFSSGQAQMPNQRYGNGNYRNKWVALLLCFFLGWMGAHKYYEGKILMGILYTFTFGLFFIGWIIDIFRLLMKPVMYLP